MRTINLMVRNCYFCYFYTEYYLKLNILNNINIAKMFYSDVCSKCTELWSFGYMHQFIYKVIGHRYNHVPVYTIPLLYSCFCLVHYLTLSFCTDNMALYIMVLCNVLFYFLFHIFILQCLIMPHK